jgi:deazaflavin-dependent oxidoreductase (nitroreductase family)
MALPKWLARFNRRFINPAAIRKGNWPVLVHTGRRSGATYRTPLDAYPTDGGYVFTVNYGTKSDWPRNVMAAGEARLEIEGTVVELTKPRLVPTEEGYRLLDQDAKTPPSLVGVEECLVVDAVSTTAVPG